MTTAECTNVVGHTTVVISVLAGNGQFTTFFVILTIHGILVQVLQSRRAVSPRAKTPQLSRGGAQPIGSDGVNE